MTTVAKPLAAVLQLLIETCKEAQHGFRLAAGHVGHRALKTTFSGHSRERGGFVSQLKAIASSLEDHESAHENFAGTRPHAWENLKSIAASGNEGDILEECVHGEEAGVAHYDEALSHDDLPPDLRETFVRQAATVRESLARLRELSHVYHEGGRSYGRI